MIKEKYKEKLKIIKAIVGNMRQDHISESSAQCAYYVILSFIPFVMLLLTLIQYTGVDAQQLLDILSNIIPENTSDMVLGIIREVYSKSIGTVSISLIFALFSAAQGLFALTQELHLIYNFNDTKNKSWLHLRLISIVETIIFIVIVALSLIVMVFGKPIISEIKEHWGLFKNYTFISEILIQIGFLIVSFILFLIIYRFMSNRKIGFKKHVRGAIFSSIALNAISFLFSRYLNIFRGFSIMYGSLTALMLIMMWIYSCFFVTFLGAEINKFYETKIKVKRQELKK